MGGRAWTAVGVLVLVALTGTTATQLSGPAAIAPSVLLVACLVSILLG